MWYCAVLNEVATHETFNTTVILQLPNGFPVLCCMCWIEGFVCDPENTLLHYICWIEVLCFNTSCVWCKKHSSSHTQWYCMTVLSWPEAAPHVWQPITKKRLTVVGAPGALCSIPALCMRSALAVFTTHSSVWRPETVLSRSSGEHLTATIATHTIR